MSSKILHDAGDRNITHVTWRKLNSQDRQSAVAPAASPALDPSAHARLSYEIEKAAEEAYARGFAMGADSCRSEASAQVQPVLERLSQSIKMLADLRPRLRRNAEEDLVKLSIAVARRILNRELSIDPDSVQAIVRVALEKLQSKEIFRVRMHASHEAAVRSCLTHLGASNQIQLMSDSSIELGDLVFETSQGDFDASLQFQLREIERGFADRLNS